MMKRKFLAGLLALALAVALTACGGGEETTLTGMVVSLEGTVVTLMEMDMSNFGGGFAEGQRPEMPEGMEGFEGFDPGAFEGTMPQGEDFPQWSGGEMPTMPEGMEFPEDMTMPANGEMPDFSGENGGRGPGSGSFNAEEMETKTLDLADAHISVEIEGGKASGSLEDIVPGASVTITLDGKGKATYVLVSAQSFGGGRGMPQGG